MFLYLLAEFVKIMFGQMSKSDLKVRSLIISQTLSELFCLCVVLTNVILQKLHVCKN